MILNKAPGGVDWVEGEARLDINRPASVSYSFLSSTGDVHIVCDSDPRVPEHKGYAHRLGCTGEYTKTKRLEEWFGKNGTWDAMCLWDRDFI